MALLTLIVVLGNVLPPDSPVTTFVTFATIIISSGGLYWLHQKRSRTREKSGHSDG
ncbi:hypothetical protein [Microbacterium sp. SMR1]|uniref:hypothetical protein n=1 Tax=Microbacterium sp. SMR1 TaxID=1497340 RepID=UPI0015EC2663|nr:hypothetical protein [Microbacterium sp. SMR1]